MMRAAWAIFFMLPPRVRLKLKQLLQGDGHKRSLFSSLIANRNAEGKERFDRALKTLAQDLQWLGPDDKITSALEIGVGYVATSLLALKGFTGATVEGIDINKVLDLRATLKAVTKSPTLEEVHGDRDLRIPSQFLEELVSISSVSQLRYWMDNNKVHYRAPASLEMLDHVNSSKRGLIYSRSVLEHIPPSQFHYFVSRLKALCLDGGHNVHFIDLTDHLSHHDHPQLFRNDDSYDSEYDSGWRGNAMLPSQILESFQKNFDVVYFATGDSLKDQRIRVKKLLDENPNLEVADKESQWILVHAING